MMHMPRVHRYMHTRDKHMHRTHRCTQWTCNSSMCLCHTPRPQPLPTDAAHLMCCQSGLYHCRGSVPCCQVGLPGEARQEGCEGGRPAGQASARDTENSAQGRIGKGTPCCSSDGWLPPLQISPSYLHHCCQHSRTPRGTPHTPPTLTLRQV